MTHAIALDVGGTTIKAGLVAPCGALAAQRTRPTPQEPQALADTLADLARELRAQVVEMGLQLVNHVGIAVPGIVDEDAGIGVYSANLGWRDAPLKAMFEEAIGAPVAFGHDVRSGALAEMVWGTGSPTMIYLAIGTGIGAAVVLAGTTFNNHGYAGELGQALVSLHGRDVVLEHYASASGIVEQYARRSGIPAREISGAEEVFAAARSGNDHARATIEVAVTLLARSLGTTLAILGSMDIVLGGGLARAGADLTEPLTQALTHRLRISPMPSVRPAKLGSWSQCLGAGYRALVAAGEIEIEPAGCDGMGTAREPGEPQ